MPDVLPPKLPNHYFSPQTELLDVARLQSARPLSLSLSGFDLQFFTGAGTFSKGAFDEGSRLLIEILAREDKSAEEANFCDLGCGWGVVATFRARMKPHNHVFAVDINPRAAQLTHLNLEKNALVNGVSWCGQGLNAVRNDWFDVIACNPPIRAGNAVIQTLFDDSLRTLRTGGSLWVVIRTAQGAKSWQKRLQDQFGLCETIEMRAGYRILKASKSS